MKDNSVTKTEQLLIKNRVDSPLVSVIIPVFNVEKYLEECINSILCQTLTDIEILCINDGSTDSSPDILRKYAEQDRRITVYSQNNRGLSSGEFSFQVQDLRRSCGVLQRSIPVPFSTRGPSSAGCLSGTLPSSISHADRQSKSWFASGNSPSKDHLYSRLIPSARGCGDRQNRTEYAVHFQFSDTRQTLFHDLR